MNEMITQLPQASNANLSDIIYAVQGYTSPTNLGTSVQETLQQVLNLVQSNIITTNSANPNGAVAGTLNQLCWDTADSLLWICTTAGTASAAVWTVIIGTQTNGQLLVGSTGNPPVRTTLSAGPGISIVNGAGSITISGTGSGIGWQTVATSGTTAADNGYITTGGSLVTLSLPATAAVGTGLAVIGSGAGGWSLTTGAGQTMQVGIATASTSVSSSNRYDSVYFICTTANTTWTVLGAPQSSGLTIV